MKSTILKLIWLLLLLLLGLSLFAQTDSVSRKRLDSLESRLNGIELRLKKAESPPRTQTRSATESGKQYGVVVAEDKGVALEIGGFIQTDAIHDFSQNSSPLGFLSSSIDIPNDHKTRTTYSVAASRFYLNGQVPIGSKLIKTTLEFDLYNTSFSPTLRHAFAEYDRIGIGMYWSNFMDVDAYPNTLDYNGPNAMIFGRQVQFRYTIPVTKATEVILALEDPVNFITLPDVKGFKPLTGFPDFTSSIQYSKDGSHIRFASVIHPITFEDDLEKRSSKIGYGVSLSGVLQQKPSNDNFVFQFNYGRGISKYFNDIGPDSYDGIWNAAIQRLELLSTWGFSTSYDHWWSDKFSSTAGWGYLKLENKNETPGQNFKASNYGILNVIYYPNSFIKGGIEYLYGSRKNVNNEKAQNSRIQLTVQLRF